MEEPRMSWRKSSYSHATENCIDIAASWRKSSFSEAGAACVEIASRWHKSSHSGMNGHCVEAVAGPVVYVADTTEGTGFERTVLEFAPGAWGAFLDSLR